MTPMALGELFGPVQCEHPDCKNDAWLIWMTRAEYGAAKMQTDAHPVTYVFRHKIGTALCGGHSPAGRPKKTN